MQELSGFPRLCCPMSRATALRQPPNSSYARPSHCRNPSKCRRYWCCFPCDMHRLSRITMLQRSLPPFECRAGMSKLVDTRRPCAIVKPRYRSDSDACVNNFRRKTRDDDGLVGQQMRQLINQTTPATMPFLAKILVLRVFDPLWGNRIAPGFHSTRSVDSAGLFRNEKPLSGC